MKADESSREEVGEQRRNAGLYEPLLRTVTQGLSCETAGLQNCSLPYDTLLWRGADSRFLDGFTALPKRVSEWKNQPLSYKGFSSTSILKNASYIRKSDKDVLLLLVKRGGQPGAAYIEQVSYNRANGKPSEYEVLLQNGAEYRIIEAQKFKEKYIVVAEVI